MLTDRRTNHSLSQNIRSPCAPSTVTSLRSQVASQWAGKMYEVGLKKFMQRLRESGFSSQFRCASCLLCNSFEPAHVDGGLHFLRWSCQLDIHFDSSPCNGSAHITFRANALPNGWKCVPYGRNIFQIQIRSTVPMIRQTHSLTQSSQELKDSF